MNILKKSCILVLSLLLGTGIAWADGRELYYNNIDSTTYLSNMTCTAVVKLNGKVLTNCELAAFDENNELRGSVVSQTTTHGERCFLAIQGEGRNGTIHFRVVYGPDNENRIIADAQETLAFVVESRVGDLKNPFVINIITVGDVNLDKKVDVADVSALISIISGKWDYSKSHGATDINGDGMTDITDVTALKDQILGK